MSEEIFFKRDDTLTEANALYFKDLLFRVSKIGTEVEFAMPKGVKREVFQPKIEKLLKPSKSLAMLGDNGVLDVQKEHSGIEVRIIGRYPYYDVLIDQYTNIFNKLLPLGIRARPTCGLHFHLITIWSAQAIPEIILANLWNLIRRYSPFLKFLFSAGNSFKSLCRRRQHNSHLELVKHTPLNMSMKKIQTILKKSKIVPEHQNFMNLEHLCFDDDNFIGIFQIEFRFPDIDFSPTSIVAKTFLFLALLLRAVDCSKYGLIHVGKIKDWRRKIDLLNMLSNNEGDLATSDTSKLTDNDFKELTEGCEEMLKFLKPSFARFENPSYRILKFMSSLPISFMRSEGLGWKEIDDILSNQAKSDRFTHIDSVDKKLVKIIELSEVIEEKGEKFWKNQVADMLWIPITDLNLRMKRLSRRKPVWDKDTKTYIFLR